MVEYGFGCRFHLSIQNGLLGKLGVKHPYQNKKPVELLATCNVDILKTR